MQTERRIWKASADESRSTIGADAAASGREAELERRPNGVSRSGAPFGKQTIGERKRRWDRLSEQSSRDGDKIASQYVIRCIKQFMDFRLLLLQGFGRTLSVTEIVYLDRFQGISGSCSENNFEELNRDVRLRISSEQGKVFSSSSSSVVRSSPPLSSPTLSHSCILTSSTMEAWNQSAVGERRTTAQATTQ